ncbi:NAD(P)-binding protein [Ceraceosorus guamensis]|uniref:3-dehydrosphinganine reductase n=1 Tax=Ceraceosorus guamensis TaxID=1522189 RepID=A0A316VRY1_9BASI|nr:NAD(P)-binding protein [Ceraceosorus guamensis]PWN38941.1 NAD(P)-binding protein [Ceraceosorus guamensis]
MSSISDALHAFQSEAKPYPNATSLLLLLIPALVLTGMISLPLPFGRSHWSAKGKHAFITGGSSGLGLALAELIVERGGSVTLVARDESRLSSAKQQVERLLSVRAGPNKGSSTMTDYEQFVQAISADVSSFEAARRAVQQASTSTCQPDIFFCCAGAATPGFFVAQSEETLRRGMNTDYWTSASMAHAALRSFISSGKKGGKIVFVSSILGMFGMVGYAEYAPAKAAICSLADTLRSEALLYDTQVHCYLPGTILSPGLERENRTKPNITLKLEGTGSGLTPRQCAQGLLKGLSRNQFNITTDFLTELVRSAHLQNSPGNGWILDGFKCALARIVQPLWRWIENDRAIQKEKKMHLAELQKTGVKVAGAPVLASAPPRSE